MTPTKTFVGSTCRSDYIADKIGECEQRVTSIFDSDECHNDKPKFCKFIREDRYYSSAVFSAASQPQIVQFLRNFICSFNMFLPSIHMT